MRTRFEMKQVFFSPAVPVLLAWGLITTFSVLTTQRDPDGRPRFPTTTLMIPKIEESFEVILLVVAIYYAGELVWRERDRRVHELIDASPLPNWGYVVPKTFALALVLASMLLTNVLAAVAVQLSLGYSHLELGKYLLWYVLPATWDMLLLAALTIFVQALSPHKAVGWAVMVAFLVGQHLNTFIQHKLLLYGEKPAMPLSEMNGAAAFWKGPWTFRVYWGAFAILLLLCAHLLWRRGTEVRLRPRLAQARRRITGNAGWVAAAAVAVFAATGAYAFYNTNVLHRYRTQSEEEQWAVQLEKRYRKYNDLPQPAVAQMTLNVDVDPQNLRAVTQGKYVLRNETSQPIRDVHVRLLYGALKFTHAEMAGARLIVDDDEFGYRIYRLDKPMAPGDERTLTFATQRWHRGFDNNSPYTGLVANGTFINRNELTPVIGTGSAGMLEDPVKRAKYGLSPEVTQSPKLEDLSATMTSALSRDWAQTDITVSTTADQTPIAPGRKVSDVTRGGRRIARFVSTAPIHPTFSIQSARYAEKRRRHAGVDLVVYYHPPHEWNVDRMLDAMAVSLDYCQANFGPYPFDHVRIVEFPGYRYFAQAFAGTIPYSENYGFVADLRKRDTLDIITGTTAHELAHQYWGHQVTGAGMEGQAVLSETLAQYSAMMIAKKLRGEDQIRRHLQYELDRYLDGRAYGATTEPTLARVQGEKWVMYDKGLLVMYLLQKRIGEEAVNRALRNLLARYKFKGAPYPRSSDLVAFLRAEAKTAEEQNLITDLFERITLYDLKVMEPTAVRRADGKWDVTVPIEAKKLYADGKGSETETPLDERIEVGLFTAQPGRDAFDAKDVVLMERQPIRTGRQVLKFVTTVKPQYAGVDPYNFYIDRTSSDNVRTVQ
ncbi:MAG: aminopeptidase [Acidobacteriota bacterium]|nr:aminopeptidase [Acidobacteriota bacterium]